MAVLSNLGRLCSTATLVLEPLCAGSTIAGSDGEISNVGAAAPAGRTLDRMQQLKWEAWGTPRARLRPGAGRILVGNVVLGPLGIGEVAQQAPAEIADVFLIVNIP